MAAGPRRKIATRYGAHRPRPTDSTSWNASVQPAAGRQGARAHGRGGRIPERVARARGRPGDHRPLRRGGSQGRPCIRVGDPGQRGGRDLPALRRGGRRPARPLPSDRDRTAARVGPACPRRRQERPGAEATMTADGAGAGCLRARSPSACDRRTLPAAPGRHTRPAPGRRPCGGSRGAVPAAPTRRSRGWRDTARGR